MNIKLRIKLKELKDNLVRFWYKLMTPIANDIINYSDYKYHERKKEVRKWSDEYAVKRCAKLVIKRLINCSDFYEGCLRFDVAEWCNYDYANNNTIEQFIIDQDIDVKLKQWGRERLSMVSVNRIKMITNLLKIELEKNSMIDCEYIIDKQLQDSWRATNYKKTLVVRLK